MNAEDGYPVKSGTQSIRFEIKEGDCSHAFGWNDCTGDRYRSELTSTKKRFQAQEVLCMVYLSTRRLSISGSCESVNWTDTPI